MAGRRVLVCGGTGAIGAAIASAFAAESANVCVHYHRRQQRAEEICRDLRQQVSAIAVGGDLADAAAADAVFDACEASIGPVDVVVNCAHAGSPRHRPIRESDWDDWDVHLAALRAHVNVCRRAVHGMRERRFGRVILLSGALSLRPARNLGPYAATKSALNALTRTLALEEGDAGITANVVAPGRVASDGESDAALADLESTARQLRALAHLPTPAEVAAVVVALAGPLGAQLTGLVVPVTAGEVLG